MNAEDKERLAIVRQIEDRKFTSLVVWSIYIIVEICKRGSESPTVDAEEEFEIERLLHGYVSMCHNASMELMKTNQQRAAGRMLRQCQDFVEGGVPRNVA